MKIKAYHNDTLWRLVNVLAFYSIPFCIYLLTTLPLYYTALSIISCILIAKVGHGIAQHRYFAHRAFNTGKKREWILAFLATLSNTGSIIYFAINHRIHHNISDKDGDPNDSTKLSLFEILTLKIKTDDTEHFNLNVAKDLLKNKSARFFHNWYWPTIILYSVLLILIDPYLFVAMYLLPLGYSVSIMVLGTITGHKYGYRNFDTDDKSVNNFWVNLLFLGEGNHNNHHYKPSSWDSGFTGKWTEYDIGAPIIKYIFLKRESV
jgi:fatty-acid desaturase